MTTAGVDSSRLLATIGQVSLMAKNHHGDLIATASSDTQSSNNIIQIWANQGSSEWSLLSTLHAAHSTTCLAFCHPESGLLLATGTKGGSLVIYEARRPRSSLISSTGPDVTMATDQSSELNHDSSWSAAAELSCGKHPISSIAFAPRQLGLAIAVASTDGSCFLVEGDRPLAPETWSLQSSFKVSNSSSSYSCRTMSPEGSHLSLSWRPSFDPHVAPLMAVGGGGVVEVWQYIQSTMSWQQVKRLQLGSSVVGGSGLNSGKTLVHWAPTLGRPSDLIAASQESNVEVFGLTGDTSDLVEASVATLEHQARVHKVEFNALGTTLAVATEDNRLYLYKPDFAGKFLLVSTIGGLLPSEEEGQE